MRILGIESTCDETGVAIVDDGHRILSNVVATQIPLHERFGGVVPEIASRAHVAVITRMIERALVEAGLARTEPGAPPPVDAIAVAQRPGLVGSLLVGVTAAKSLALAWGLPLVAVDHVEAHIYSVFLSLDRETTPVEESGVLPAVSLIVSGGHTSLYASSGFTSHRLLGSTRDDAVGEAFDKAAAILGLGYPGGPAISRAAAEGSGDAIRFPRTLLEPDSLDFSFSGIKTAVLYHVKGQDAARGAPPRGAPPRGAPSRGAPPRGAPSRGAPPRGAVSVADVAASFEAAVVDVLVEKLRRAVRHESAARAIVGGGVAANRRLRASLDRLSHEEGVEIRYPPLALCTDNAAMIAALGEHLLRRGETADLDIDVSPSVAR